MADIEPLVTLDQLKTNRIRTAHGTIYQDYDEVSDSLVLSINPIGSETIAYYVDGDVALLYEPATYEIVGVQIDDFRLSFIPRHQASGEVWKLSEVINEMLEQDIEIEVREEYQNRTGLRLVV